VKNHIPGRIRLRQDRQRVVLRLAAVNYDRLIHLHGEFELSPKHPVLLGTIREVVMIIQTHLADCHHIVPKHDFV